jgi:hypothetical protein
LIDQNHMPQQHLSEHTGEINGFKFFSRSPFRSLAFLLGTLLCLVGIVLSFRIAYHNWNKSNLSFLVLLWMVAVGGMVTAWYRIFEYIGDVQELLSANQISDLAPDSALHKLLDSSTALIYSLMLSCFGAICILLVALGYFADRATHLPGH